MQLPEPHQQQAQTGQPVPNALQQAVNQAITEELIAGYRDNTPLPLVGATPPVDQPGRPPMSQRATDASALMLSGGAASLLVGGSASLVMVASGSADPVVCAIVLGAPAVLVLAIGRLVGRVKAAVEAAPATHHHHYSGHVDQRTVHSKTTGMWAKTNNQQ
ncbi:hypothetical protein ACFZBE_18000 [Streptomyces sp. NPDC008061]|uniref:hypothetical protein n=1 Tax=Streptomyces sp. NPDC008061 TaxID=3364805 RepID=UPI0036ED3B93